MHQLRSPRGVGELGGRPGLLPVLLGSEVLLRERIQGICGSADFAQMLGKFFSEHGYLWPDDIIKALETKPFAKMKSTAFWWHPKYNCLGVEGIRDPDAPCERFYRGEPDRHFQDCETDGHYLCQECVCRKPAEVDQARLL